MKDFEDIISISGWEDTRGHSNTLDVVDIISRSARGGKALAEIIAEPLCPVRPHEDEVQIVDQPCLALRCDGASGFVGPGKRDVKAVGGIKGERIEEAEPWREEFFVVHEGVEGGGTVHGQDGAFQIHLTPTFGSVGNVRRPEVTSTVDHGRFHQRA